MFLSPFRLCRSVKYLPNIIPREIPSLYCSRYISSRYKLLTNCDRVLYHYSTTSRKQYHKLGITVLTSLFIHADVVSMTTVNRFLTENGNTGNSQRACAARSQLLTFNISIVHRIFLSLPEVVKLITEAIHLQGMKPIS